ncbi:hypothetical protein [Intrasporangium calvum]|uniref:Uncharacterized protein n=1 Tax=Intrasporangium calvum (strain ATCC 23552 / DSM 43043 / JCM 3097 / NBRC 12989 / NCIMB 10167 / NRRL B-3866 / 7 KIP) TaxID=710696 RepID=E6S937_INTC7|nr:hypothetical protein [Intrasporangium calvum]ADU49212.1 hypothetical protein Intca_2711 [Intrasporangium calvum DSM 43043]
MTESPPRSAAPLEIVERHQAAALAALEATTGGAPLCRVDGTRQTVKASEGAAAALSDVRRALRREAGEPTGAVAAERAQAVIEEVRSAWQGISGPLAARPGSGEYVAGGLDALTALEDDLRGARAGGPAAPGVGDILTGQTILGGVRPTAASGERVRWPQRRRVAAVLIFVGLLVLIGATVGWPLVDAPLWSVLTAGAAVLSSLALALFVPRPGEGWRPDLGCAPCAVAGLALAVAGPWLAIETAHEGERAALAMVLGGAALARRLTEPPVCGVPGR